jgi:hypothetical protein
MSDYRNPYNGKKLATGGECMMCEECCDEPKKKDVRSRERPKKPKAEQK